MFAETSWDGGSHDGHMVCRMIKQQQNWTFLRDLLCLVIFDVDNFSILSLVLSITITILIMT